MIFIYWNARDIYSNNHHSQIQLHTPFREFLFSPSECWIFNENIFLIRKKCCFCVRRMKCNRLSIRSERRIIINAECRIKTIPYARSTTTIRLKSKPNHFSWMMNYRAHFIRWKFRQRQQKKKKKPKKKKNNHRQCWCSFQLLSIQMSFFLFLIIFCQFLCMYAKFVFVISFRTHSNEIDIIIFPVSVSYSCIIHIKKQHSDFVEFHHTNKKNQRKTIRITLCV